MSDERKIVDLNAARQQRERAEREAARTARRAAQPPREGVSTPLYFALVVVLVLALAGGYALVAAI